jgi:hypothetical protein
METWKPILNYEDSYEVSSEGRVRSINKLIPTGIRHSSKRLRKGKVLKPNLKRGGYLSVDLSKDNKTKTVSVHRLVARAFLPNKGLPQVNHKNGIKTDNRVSNLEWCDAYQNQQHRYTVLGHIGKRKQVLCVQTGEIHGSSRQAAEWLNANKYQYSKQVTSLARKIRKCCVGELEKAHGYKWTYQVEKFND